MLQDAKAQAIFYGAVNESLWVDMRYGTVVGDAVVAACCTVGVGDGSYSAAAASPN